MRLRLLAAAVAASLALAAAGGAAPAATSAPAIEWTVATPGSSPPYLSWAAGAYDASTMTFVMFGGLEANGTMSGNTWVWNGSNWTEYTGGPPARDLASMAFDPVLDQFVLFGGQNAQGALLGDTWAWNGASWCELSAGSGLAGTCNSNHVPAPSPRSGATLTYDAAGFLVLFGGTGYSSAASGGTVGTPTTSAQQSATSSGSVPTAETTLNDTWQWEGSQVGWVQAKVAGPPARSGATATYDYATRTSVLFGGETSVGTTGQPRLLGDTWIWTGHSWAQAHPPASPPARFAAVADDDRAAGGPLVTGGQGQPGALSDSWVWNGSTWIQAHAEGQVQPRAGAAGGYLVPSAQLVVFGGSNGTQTLGVTTIGTIVANRTSPGGSTPTSTAPTRSTTTEPGTARTGRTTTTTVKKKTMPTTVKRRPQTPPSGPASPGSTAWITTSATKLQRGSSISVDGAGFQAGSTVTLTFHSNPYFLGTAYAGAAGGFQMEVAVPKNAAPGSHTIEATGTEANGRSVSATATVYVTGPSKTSAATKAFLIGLAILVPVMTYLAMALNAALRRRRHPVTGPGNAPQSPS